MDALLSPGDVCGDHQVIRLLGSGGFAQVYEVRDRQNKRLALKILDADAEARPKLRARLAQEGAALSLLDHANVVRFHSAGLDGERLYLLLEMVEGQTLRAAMLARQGPYPVETVTRWIGQAAEGVAAAHRQGIVHRDLKPENLLITPQDVVKVIDFGLAKLEKWGVKTTLEQKLGTALYMSPEQIRGNPPDPRMDVYALGLILYEGLASRHAIVPGPASVFDVCTLQMNQIPRPLCEMAPWVSPALGAVADQAIQKDPALRFQDVRAFADALHAARARESQPQRDALRDMAPPSPPARAPIARTQPMSAFVEANPSHPRSPLAQTAPQGGELPFAVTAAIRTGVPDAVSTPPAVRTWMPADTASVPPNAALVPPPPVRPTRVSMGLVLGVLAAAAVGLAGGAWMVIRLLQ